MMTVRAAIRMKGKRGSRGFTLIETVMAISIFLIIMVSTYSVMVMASTIFNTNSVYSQLNQHAMQTLRYLGREIGQTSPNQQPDHLDIGQDGNGNSVVRFQIPVDWDNDGDAVTDNLNPQNEWGAYLNTGESQNGMLNGWIQYLVVNNQLTRRVLNNMLAPVQNSDQVVAGDVQQFTVVQNVNVLTMTLTVQRQEASSASRNLQSTFTTRTVLRNAVN